MSVLEFIASLVGSLAWPAAVVIVVIVFRNPIGEQLSRLAALRGPGGWSAEFRERIRQIETQAELLPAPSTYQPEELEFASDVQMLPQLAENFPQESIVESWLLVERSIRSAAARIGLDLSPIWPASRVAERLAEEGHIPRDLIGLIESLRTVRNIAAHSAKFDVPIDGAVSYAQAARSVAEVLERIGR